MTADEIRKELFSLRDEEYSAFQAKLIPTAEPGSIIGVRTPALRALAVRLVKQGEAQEFLGSLPHRYFDENQLHAFIISEIKDFDRCADEVCRFLPYVDNWATCDQLSPKVFAKHRDHLKDYIDIWLGSGDTYTVRFAVGMLMKHYLDDDFDPSYPERVSEIRSDEYYINMTIAWYFATALAKQYDTAVKYLEERRLDRETHNKTIQKAIESLRISPSRKDCLRSLKIKQR